MASVDQARLCEAMQASRQALAQGWKVLPRRTVAHMSIVISDAWPADPDLSSTISLAFGRDCVNVQLPGAEMNSYRTPLDQSEA